MVVGNKINDQNLEKPVLLIPLTSAQKSIYIAHLLDDSQVAYNMAHYREIFGEIDVVFFSRAVELAIEDTPAYRSRVRVVNDAPCMEVMASIDWGLTTVDLSKENDPEGAAWEWINRERNNSFDLTVGPLFKYIFFILGIDRFYLFHCAHHIIVDGSGAFQFERNVFDIYNALLRGEEIEAPGGLDNSLECEEAYQRSPQYDVDKDFWKRELEGLEPQLSLSPRPLVADRLFNRAYVALSPEIVSLLKKFCSQRKVSLQRLLVAISALYYARMTGQSEFAFEIPLSLRRNNEDLLSVDMRSGSVIIKLGISPTTTINNFIKLISNKMRSALRHQYYRQEYLKKDLHFDQNSVRFSINVLPSSDISIGSGVCVKTYNLSHGPVKDTNITIYLEGNNEDLLIELDCNKILYTERETQIHLDRLITFIATIVSTNENEIISSLPLIDNNERKLVISSFNDTQQEIPSTTLPELFALQVEKSPDATALIFGDEEVSYRELDNRANRLARYLISQEIGPEDIVAIGLDRSVEMVVALLGVLKSGAAYLPLDPDYPVERLTFMLTDSNAKRLITTKEIYERLLGGTEAAQFVTSSEHADTTSYHLSSYQNADVTSHVGLSSVAFDEHQHGREAFSERDAAHSHLAALPEALLLDDAILQAELAALSNAPISDNERVQPLTPDNLAYVIYTSGTTGKPKGVATTVRDIIALAYRPSYCELTTASVVVQYAPVSFDAATFEIWGSLVNGAKLAIAPPGKIELNVLGSFLRNGSITTA